ncbi:MAG TPA: phosphotransferase [Candidatus Obscuribacterales bacterium]
MPVENESLVLIQPPPQERLSGWLEEFYGKPVQIVKRQLLRHRDLSLVERLWLDNALPESLIYKVVLPPWDIEQELHERVLIPSISNSAQLFMSAHFGHQTAMFLEDLGTQALLNLNVTGEFAAQVGRTIARMHRAYSYRIDELMHLNVLRALLPLDYETFAAGVAERLRGWNLISQEEEKGLVALATLLAQQLAGEPISLVHGDLYAENLLVRGGKLFVIDWSWFTHVGVSTMDLASLVSDHFKNGNFAKWRGIVLEAYCEELDGRDPADARRVLPYAETLSRLMFLNWLVERRGRGIMGTTVGPVDELIPKVVAELAARRSDLSAA